MPTLTRVLRNAIIAADTADFYEKLQQIYKKNFIQTLLKILVLDTSLHLYAQKFQLETRHESLVRETRSNPFDSFDLARHVKSGSN